MLVDKTNASMITIRRFLKRSTFHLTGWRLSHQPELPGDLPVPLKCQALTLNTIEMQLSEAVADTSMLQCSAKFRILFINAHFVADFFTHCFSRNSLLSQRKSLSSIMDGLQKRKKKKLKWMAYRNDRNAVKKFLDIHIGTKHRLVAFKRPLIFYFFLIHK